MGDTKSKAGKRDIPLIPMVVNTPRQWQQVCPKGELGLVFPNGRGNVETLPNIYKRLWKPLQLKCGLTIDTGENHAAGQPILEPRYGFHMLRHAAASLFIAYLGWTPKRIQTVMGHCSISISKLRVAGSNPAGVATQFCPSKALEPERALALLCTIGGSVA